MKLIEISWMVQSNHSNCIACDVRLKNKILDSSGQLTKTFEVTNNLEREGLSPTASSALCDGDCLVE